MSLLDTSTSSPKIFTISSSTRISGTNESFQSYPILLGDNDFTHCIISQITIPKTWYTIQDNLNTFQLSETVGSITTIVSISFPIGNYNRISLASTLQTLLNSNSPNMAVYTISYPNTGSSADTGKFTFTSSIPHFSFIFSSISPYNQLGFNIGTISTNTSSITSTNIINLQYISSLNVVSDIVQNSPNNILSSVLNVGTFLPNSYIFHEEFNYDITLKELSSNTNNSWNFNLTDQNGIVPNLNGVPWSFTLIFLQRSNLNEINKETIRLKLLEKQLEISKQEIESLSNKKRTEPGNNVDEIPSIYANIWKEFDTNNNEIKQENK